MNEFDLHRGRSTHERRRRVEAVDMSRPDPELRSALISNLRSNHPGMCRAWFDDIEPVDFEGGVLRLCVREPVQLRYLQRACAEPFQEAAQAVTGMLVSVRFVSPEECEQPTPTTTGSGSARRSRGPEVLP